MIGNRAVRLALRARLLSLTVVTTGVTTLEATAAGYARAIGSFLTDGFARGMEVQPAGFTQMTPGVITEVAALTMKISGGRTIEAAAAGRTLSVGLPASRAWENVAFTPATGVPYVTEEFVPGPGKRVTLGEFAQIEYLPLYFPKIYVPAGVAVGASDAYADAIIRHFPPGLDVLATAQDQMRVRGDTAPYAGQLLQTTPGFAVVPVNVPLWLRTPNVI